MFLFNNLINPAGDILYNTKPVAKQPSYILHWQKTNRLLHFYKQSNQSKSKPDRSSFLFLLEIHVKWAITPVADTKCLHTVLNFTILKKLWASGHNVVRYNTPAWGNQTAMCYFVVGCGLGEEAKLFHFLLILARRCDKEEPCCHYRRRRSSRLVESRETKIFRSCTRYQLFPCQDSGMFDVTFASPVPPFLKIRAYEVWNVLLLSSCYWQK